MRHDSARLAQLRKLAILDTAPERVYDDITKLLATCFSVPIGMVNMLDDRRDWFKSCIGLPWTEGPVETSFCEAFFNTSDDLIVVEDTTLDERFAQHPLVTGEPFIRFYASARLTVRGQTVGTLCAYDTRTHHVTPEQLAQLQSLAAAAIELLGRRPEAIG